MNSQPFASARVRAAFVVEQTLGHVTHYQNLRAVAAVRDGIAPVWLPISFDVDGPARLVPVLRSNWSVRASWRARRALDLELAKDTLDVLVFHTQVTSLFSRSLMTRIPTLISLDATPLNYDTVAAAYGHRAAGNGFLDRQKYRLNRGAFHAADCLITWSDWARRSLIDDYGVDSDRIRILAPGAAPKYFEIGRTRTMSSDATADYRTRLKLLFVGGDFERKGGALLLECLRDSALASMCELHLVTHATLPAQPNVIVHHNLQPNSPELQRLFAEADLFVLPTLADCLAVVLMEAMAAGLPVITTDVGALSEAVVGGESGLVIPPGDVAALRAALVALVNDAPRRRRMATASHALGKMKFDARRNDGALLDIVAELANAQRDLRRVA